ATLAGRAVMPWDKMLPDFLCYWTAGALVASGHSPYDIDLQARVHRAHGWDKATDGLGKFDFLPYYYPPWMSFICTLLVPLGFEAAKVAWLFLNLEMLLLTGWLLSDAVEGLPRSIPIVVVPVFALSVVSLLLGQTVIPILLLATWAWRLLERGWDRGA